ncbi:hypothetical protein AKJ16_DCAP23311 [Drosera capensis]
MEAAPLASSLHILHLSTASPRLPFFKSTLPLSSSTSSFASIRRRSKSRRSYGAVSASSSSALETLEVAAAVGEEGRGVGGEVSELKDWMHMNGLPPCKVVLRERASYDENLKATHYVTASEDLKVTIVVRVCWGFSGVVLLLMWFIVAFLLFSVGDTAFSVPNSLVVTLERVLGNETIGFVMHIVIPYTSEVHPKPRISPTKRSYWQQINCQNWLAWLYEKKQGKKSFWYPYIKELDHQRGRGQLAVESPLLW